MIRVVVADDQALVRGGFPRPGGLRTTTWKWWARQPTGLRRSSWSCDEQPDVVLMDIRMPAMDGLEATREIIVATPSSATRVLVLTTFDLDEYVFAALQAGASGFLLKDTPPADLLAGIRIVARRRRPAVAAASPGS